MVSSAAVYGPGHEGPIGEDARLDPASPYGCHKLVMELLCRSYARSFGVSIVLLRLFSVYGEGLQKQLLWDLCSKLARNRCGQLGGLGPRSARLAPRVRRGGIDRSRTSLGLGRLHRRSTEAADAARPSRPLRGRWPSAGAMGLAWNSAARSTAGSRCAYRRHAPRHRNRLRAARVARGRLQRYVDWFRNNG